MFTGGDCYVKVLLNHEYISDTNIIFDDRWPRFDTSFDLGLVGLDTRITVELWDWDRLHHDYQGDADLYPRQIWNNLVGQIRQYKYGSNGGYINLALTLRPI